jgi:hypothetical protein
MGGTESNERELLKKIYGTTIRSKKIADMSDQQVIAIVLRLKRNGKI